MANGFLKITRACKIGARHYEPGTAVQVSGETARRIIRQGCGVPIGEGGALLQSTRVANEMRIERARR